MIRDKSILAIVPARGGSVGIPRKNIREAAGKPLIAWTIEEAKKSRYIDRLILSSEDDEIISVARQWGCEVPFVRPAELSQDHIPAVEPVLHALSAISEDYHYVVLLQPTSPLRRAEDIDGCIETCVSADAPVCMSVSEAEKSPYLMYTLDPVGHLIELLEHDRTFYQRQDFPKVFSPNGAVYVAAADWLRKHRRFLSPQAVAYIMPRDRSLDIDTEWDLRIFKALVSEMT
jgi:CMP-N,N'-diacetyllegionaminic acid synthase